MALDEQIEAQVPYTRVFVPGPSTQIRRLSSHLTAERAERAATEADYCKLIDQLEELLNTASRRVSHGRQRCCTDAAELAGDRRIGWKPIEKGPLRRRATVLSQRGRGTDRGRAGGTCGP